MTIASKFTRAAVATLEPVAGSGLLRCSACKGTFPGERLDPEENECPLCLTPFDDGAAE